ncbi:hypothetical protein NQ317_001156 [Molorchus minor]|uniref:Uncharacterized protein n=1 Tax=Molorchus minor TaxID=1323400 RepID=A0ABQ9JVE7_9CUCU|nr:hypothetical protein NQ317_001156 [Molorchus minor]
MLEEDVLKKDEYEKQYYGFSSTELYADIKEQTSKAIKTALVEIENGMKEEGYNEELTKQKISGYYNAFMDSAKVPLDRFKESNNELRKIFEIPNNVVLEDDKYKTGQYTDEDILNLRKEVAELEKELIREQVFLAKCKQEKELIDTVFKPTYDKVNTLMWSLKNLRKHTEADENKKKLIHLHEQHVQYYFGNDDDVPENILLSTEKDFNKWN